jgi:hypothetical protein
MHSVTYIVCFFFYSQLSGISKQKENGRFWSMIYGLFVGVFLYTKPTIGMFFTFGARGSSSVSLNGYETALGMLARVIDLTALQIAGVSLLLATLFYFTVQMVGQMNMYNYRVAFVLVPGVLINSLVAYLLLSALV